MADDWFKGGTPDKPNRAGLSRSVDDPVEDKLADDVMDMVLESVQGRGSAVCRPAEEREQEKRDEIQFLAALAGELNERLSGQGIRVLQAGDDGTGEGYRIKARDRAGRPYDITVTFDEFHDKMRGLKGGQVRACIDHVAERILAARATYFARMQ